MVSRARSRSVLSLITVILVLVTLPSHTRPIAAGADAREEAATVAEAGTLLLAPEDTSLNINANNYSTDTVLTTYTWPDYQVANAVVMKFDLSALPAGALVTEATLHLALVSSDKKADAVYTVTAHKVLGKNPVISRATGYTADGLTNWAASTCCFKGVPLAQADISAAYDQQAIDKTPGFKSWTVTTLVQEWLADPDSNFGLVLNSDTSKLRDRYRFFASMEHPDTSLRPFLRVTFAAGDATPPSVTITAPAPGATVSGAVSVAARATDNVGVAAVQFQLDGQPLGTELTSAPFEFIWDTTTLSDGTHALAAVARDWAGNSALSTSVGVTVNNGIVLLSPEDTSLNINANNYSADALLTTYTWPDYQVANALLMKFDLSALPAGAFVTNATLHLALVESDGTGDLIYAVTAHKMIGRNPVLSKATGYTADGITGWTPSACCYNGVPLAQADISAAYDRQVIDKTPDFKTWTITNMVHEWLRDPATNLGILLNSDASQPRDRYRFFASMEHPDANLHPYLRIEFSSTPDATAPSVTITAPAPDTIVSGMVPVAATASDDVGVAGVQFELDGAPLGPELTAGPYVLTWDATTTPDGAHILTATARDAAGNVTRSNGVSVRNDQTPPVISGITASGVTTSGATITWTTDEAGDSQVEYGLTTAYGSVTPLNGSLVTTHDVAVSGMTDATLYHFRVRSRDAAGNFATSGDFTFRTLDGTPPTVSITVPTGGANVSGTITVAAGASDNVGVVGVQFKVDGANLGAEDTTAPYSVSWSTTTAADGSHTLTAVARDAASNEMTSAAVTVTVANTAPPPAGGIAALYPGDVGIESNPDVIFVERFEESGLSSVFNRWTDILNGSAMSLVADVPPGSPGTRSLNIPWEGGGVNNGGHLYKQLSTGVDDTLYVRYYIKYPTSGQYQHTGIWMGGYNPPLSWPNPQAGVKPAGNDRFIAAAEQNTQTSRFDHYNYWMNMRQSVDGKYWGNLLLNNPNVQAKSGQWTCVEHMVRLNNPVTAFNGEHAVWLDGVKVSHLGQGFPKGYWSGGIFTQDPAGSPFDGFRWRSDAKLNLNWIWLQNYASNDPPGFAGDMKFDHVVVAKKYVGCLAPNSSSDTILPTVSVSAPLAGVTISGAAVALTATAADNVGVASVQFKVDGLNVGPEDTTSPYTYSLDTTLLTNGTHMITAVARDAAGNQATSAAVSVTVSNVSTDAGLLFESNWDTATGSSGTAVTDSGRWPNYWEFNNGTSVQLLSVVSGGVNGHNALRVQQRGSTFAANVQVDNFVAPSRDYYLRYYMKNDDTSSAGDHIVTVDTYQYSNLTFMRKYGSASSWRFVVSLYGCGYTYPIGHWGPSQALANGEWYRFEYHVDFVDSTHVQVHPRVYDAAGTLILTDADFKQSDFGSATWNGRSDWTLASYYGAGYSFCVDPAWMNDLGLGNNGQTGATDTGRYWYFSAVQIRTDSWPGPVPSR